MKIYFISFTKCGGVLSEKLIKKCIECGHECIGFSTKKDTHLYYVENGLDMWIKNIFSKADAIVFIGACGIAVRTIAPCIKDKTTDPGIVVLDEGGHFAISLLSGHIGGANNLARTLAGFINAIPIITTATDVNGFFAVDSWAFENDIFIESMDMAKKISAKLLDGKKIGVSDDFQIKGSLPKGLSYGTQVETGISISYDENKKPFENTLTLVPRRIFIGLGCRKGTDLKTIEAGVFEALAESKISIHALKGICSIDIKKEEKGIMDFCKKYNLNFFVYSKERLMEEAGAFSSSKFVEETTGVDCVCERAAMAGAENGQLILKKTIFCGITVAIAEERRWISFER